MLPVSFLLMLLGVVGLCMRAYRARCIVACVSLPVKSSVCLLCFDIGCVGLLLLCVYTCT